MTVRGIDAHNQYVFLNNNYTDPNNDTPQGDTGVTDLAGSKPTNSAWNWWIP